MRLGLSHIQTRVLGLEAKQALKSGSLCGHAILTCGAVRPWPNLNQGPELGGPNSSSEKKTQIRHLDALDPRSDLQARVRGACAHMEIQQAPCKIQTRVLSNWRNLEGIYCRSALARHLEAESNAVCPKS